MIAVGNNVLFHRTTQPPFVAASVDIGVSNLSIVVLIVRVRWTSGQTQEQRGRRTA